MKIDKEAVKTLASDVVAQIGSRVRSERKRQGLSQEALAEDADINAKHLSAVENGKESNLSLGYVIAVATALDIDYLKLLQD